MFPSRILIPFLIFAPAVLVAGCAANPPEQLAAKDCKIVVADFRGKPSRNVTPAEQAEAELRMSRLAQQRGGYRTGTNLAAEMVRDCD